ncbi:putative baseplate assembly protein [Bradyrhizobium liaoningense]|uniref:putative baseplate assembly protein n=1 Tax=Bradyrhizobium liaoningense TaxID=43992 RepID=UPI001BADEABD|nr:putative baseplate assembly protein [Bradyrhizobium liaoningense]MBR0820223.1 putative baseplate assembly protein [Bradyrhizobium liaoningense]
MALKDAVPIIDDRRFDDIVEEVKTRIARYTPEWQPVWNDHNDSDPGITLAQLLAWLSEMLLYRMGKVPELNYLKFLEMVGIELQAAQPARVDVMFPVTDTTTMPFIDVPPRTQVSAPADDGGPPLIYETEKSARALTATLQSVQSYDSGVHRDLTAANEALDPYLPFGELALTEAALVLGLGFPSAYPTPDDFPDTTFDIAVYAKGDRAEKPVVTCGPGQTAFPSARVQWEFWNGAEWQRMAALKDGTLAFTRSGFITLRAPAPGPMKRDYVGTYPSDGSKPKLFWIRARLAKAQYETPPTIVAIRTNMVMALQAQTVQGEVLGGTDGSRNQTWELANTPVIAGSVRIQIDDGTGPAVWEVREDLLDAGSNDPVLALSASSGTLNAGDGVHGAVPIANAQNPDANVVALEYRYGGGARGNVPARAINSLITPVEGIDGGNVTNLFAAVGGREEERIEAAKERARRSIRAQGRAVTLEDFEVLAKQAGDIARAKAFPLLHPQFPTVEVPGAISVVIVPNAKRVPGRPFMPMPSEGLLRTVCSYLDARRLLTSEVFVVAPSYQEIRITADIVAEDDADTAGVREQAEAAIAAYFDPIIGGDEGDGWGFGETVRYSKVYQRIFSVEGVDSIERLVITVDGEDFPECKDVPIAANSLLFSGEHQLEVRLTDAEAAA